MDPQYPNQSRKANEARVALPITREPATIRKAPFGRRVLGAMFLGDAQSTWESAIWQSFFPNLRDNIEDSVINGIRTLFGGSSAAFGRSRSTSHYTPQGQISRHSPDRALGSRGVVEPRMSREDKQAQNLRVIEIASRAEAQAVLEAMNATIDQYDVITLAEFYQMVRITPDHTDFKFGWEDLGGSVIVHAHQKYFLDLPPLIELK